MKCAFHDNISLDNYTKLDVKDRLIHEHLFIESLLSQLPYLWRILLQEMRHINRKSKQNHTSSFYECALVSWSLEKDLSSC
jgi:hypothetical protein